MEPAIPQSCHHALPETVSSETKTSENPTTSDAMCRCRFTRRTRILTRSLSDSKNHFVLMN